MNMISRETAQHRIWAIVPAAGHSRRMGVAKQLLPFQNSSILGTVVQNVLQADVDGVVVVMRSEIMGLINLPEDKRVHVITNDHNEGEMIDSIRIGMRKLQQFELNEQDGILVTPGDMPSISQDIHRRCIAAYTGDPSRIVIATYKGKRGHPVVFNYELKKTIDRLEGGLNKIQQSIPERVYPVESDNCSILQDIDTQIDYQVLGER